MVVFGKKIEENHLYLFAVFIFFLLLGVLIPLNFGDDVNWGSAIGMAKLKNGFDNYNGRYLGNVIIMGITRFTSLRVIVYASINTAIVGLIQSMVAGRKAISIFFSFILLLLMPSMMYRQTFGWFSGFANYNIGTFFLLLNIWLLLRNKSFLLVFLVSFAGQLFMENITLFNIVSALVLFKLLAKKTNLLTRLAYIVGSVSGALLMFNNSVYHQISNGADGYRTIDFSRMLQIYLTKYTEALVLDNWVVLLVICVMVVLLCRTEASLSFSSKFIMVYTILAVIIKNADLALNALPFSLLIVINLASLVYLVALALVFYRHPKLQEDRLFMLFFGIGMGILLAPFLVITPFGGRVSFPSYTFFVILATRLFNACIDIVDAKQVKKYMTTGAVFLALFFVIIHGANRWTFENRLKSAIIDRNNRTITVVDVPFPQFGHDLSPGGRVLSEPRLFWQDVPAANDSMINVVPYQSLRFK